MLDIKTHPFIYLLCAPKLQLGPDLVLLFLCGHSSAIVGPLTRRIILPDGYMLSYVQRLTKRLVHGCENFVLALA